MRPARFLHVFGSFDLGGAEARTVALMGAFGDAAVHTVLVANRAALSARDAVPPSVQASFPEGEGRMLSGWPHPARLYRLARSMRGHDLVLTYAWGAMDMVLAHRLFARPLGLPPLVHHEDGLDPPATGAYAAARVAYRRFAMRAASRLVVPSRSLGEVAASLWAMPADRTILIANGIDMTTDAPALPIPGLSRQAGATLVCTVAGLRPEKNVRRLVRSAATAGDDVQLAILGEGPGRTAILAQARSSGNAERVHLAGFLPDPRRYLGQADIFALSSDTEQCPIALIEAMAAGLPAVATDVGDVRSMVAHENLPFIVPAEDEAGFAQALRRLSDDPHLRARIGRANAAKARRDFDAKVMVERYRNLYWSLMPPR